MTESQTTSRAEVDPQAELVRAALDFAHNRPGVGAAIANLLRAADRYERATGQTTPSPAEARA